jgi:hypothetical protein
MMEAIQIIFGTVPKAFFSAIPSNGAFMLLAYVLIWKLLGKRLKTGEFH